MKKNHLSLLTASILAVTCFACTEVFCDVVKPSLQSNQQVMKDTAPTTQPSQQAQNSIQTPAPSKQPAVASTQPVQTAQQVKPAAQATQNSQPTQTAQSNQAVQPAKAMQPRQQVPTAQANQEVQPIPGQVVQGLSGMIIDASTKKPVEGAIVTLGEEAVHTGANGAFTVKGPGKLLMVRAPGYRGQKFNTKPANNQIALTPFKVKALYLTVYGVSSTKLRENAIKVAKKNNMNALVIDVKGDRGFIPFKVDIPLAQQIGAQETVLIKDMPAMVSYLKSQGMYLIARIVVFKDDKLAGAKPDWAVKKGGSFFRDREHLRWVDPFRQEVWDYNIQIAKAAAALGFDEVQFDYVRCPDTKGVVFSKESTRENRTETITGFLSSAHKALAPTGIMVGADIFGYVPWNYDDTGIGQEIDKAVNAVDIVCPMLYPSGFQFGIPNYRNPVLHPYEIVYLSLKKAQDRTNISSLRFRPWLQAFRDYAFHGGFFTEPRMRTQIKAANDFGASGYMFWNPGNVYPTGQFD